MKTQALFVLFLLSSFFDSRAQTGGNGLTLLPENLAYFTADRIKGSVILQWQTVNEQNSKGFNVQRKTAGGWETVAFVPSNAPNGSSSAKVSYQYTDGNPFKGVSQYQVVETTNDNKKKASEVKAVKGESQSGRITVFPNPCTNGRISLLFDNKSARDVTVADAAARTIKQISGTTESTLTVENLSPGFYFICIIDRTSREIFAEKIFVANR